VDGSGADTAWVTSPGVPDPVSGSDLASRWAAVVLEPDTVSVSTARRWARETVEAWDADGQGWSVSQLLTEVVTNAVLHADTRFRVRLEQDLGTGRLRCEVTDTGAARPRVRHHSAEATTGRGLQMVADLARGWGVIAFDGAKTVWFELDPDADLRLSSDGGQGDGSWPGELGLAEPTGRDSAGPTGRSRPEALCWRAAA
jgi:anti-sigma regulatory factor (Ser/Thr protein kinase)